LQAWVSWLQAARRQTASTPQSPSVQQESPGMHSDPHCRWSSGQPVGHVPQSSLPPQPLSTWPHSPVLQVVRAVQQGPQFSVPPQPLSTEPH
jgi:hypothetical protein